jgi:hypothetical protein
LDSEPGDQQAVPGARQNRNDQASRYGDAGRQMFSFQQPGRYRGRDCHHCTHRKIDPACGNHQDHAQRQEHDLGSLIQHVEPGPVEMPVQHLDVKEAGREELVEQQQ